MTRIGILLLGLAITGSPAGAQGGACRLAIDSVGGEGIRRQLGQGVVHFFGGGGVLAHCRNRPIQMSSDSFAAFTERRRANMIGDMWFQDSTITLRADRAFYFWSDEHLEAFDDVVLTNRVTGSVLRGPNLTYYRASPPLRDSAEIVASGRPEVQYRPSPTENGEPYTILADRFRFVGNTLAWAGGNVMIQRDDFNSAADSAELDNASGAGLLIGGARVESADSGGYLLRGSSIAYRTSNGGLEWVQSRDSAVAESEQWDLGADTVEFDLEDDLIQHGRAWSRAGLARASSTEYVIFAESLAIDTPEQVLRELRGFRRALARAADSTESGEYDWIAGDSIVASFDSTFSGERILRQLEALGNARAFYRIPDEAGGPPGINYSRGDRIVAIFGPVGIDRVHVVGNADGIYLEPRGRR